MSNNPDIPEREWSKEADVAFDTIESYKQACKSFMWISGVYKEHTAFAIKFRDDAIKHAFSEIRKPVEKHFPKIATSLIEELDNIYKLADDANCDYDGDTPADDYFNDYLNDYARTVVTALKKQMDEDEQESFSLAMDWSVK